MGSEVYHPNKLKYGLRTSTLVYLCQPFCNHEIRILVLITHSNSKSHVYVAKTQSRGFSKMHFYACQRLLNTKNGIINRFQAAWYAIYSEVSNRTLLTGRRTGYHATKNVIVSFQNIWTSAWYGDFKYPGYSFCWGLQDAVWSSTRKSFVYPSVKWNFL